MPTISPPGRRRGWANLFFPARPLSKLGAWARRWAQVLRAIGPTWRAAPVRRLIQVACLLIYLTLFFYSAWPWGVPFSSRLIPDKRFLPLESFLWIDPLVGLSTAIAARAWNIALVGLIAIGLVTLLFPRGFCGYICPLGTLIDAFDFAIGKPLRRLFRLNQTTNDTKSTKPCPDIGQAPSHREADISVCHSSASGDIPVPRADESSLAANNKTVHLQLAPASPPPPRRPWWMALKFYFLAAVLVASLLGILLSGYVAAIPVLTRGLFLSAGQLQLGLAKNWGLVGEFTPAICASLLLFAVVFFLGLMGPRFWCRYVCPSGALFSVFNLLRIGERKVDSSCIKCNKCVEICPFDAIKPDFTTRTLDCTFCQSCGGVCPTHAIKFSTRWDTDDLKPENDPAPDAPSLSRRGVVLSLLGGAIAAAGTRAATPALPPHQQRPLRPPGSLPEEQFLDLCIRCGECFKVCPGPVLHTAGLKHGLEGLWAPVAVPSHAGCHQDCNFCTLVCPTHAIVPLTIEQKRKTPMGLAIVHTQICLPHAGKEECKLCYDECEAAGYHAIEMRPIKLEVGDIPEGVISDDEREQMGKILAPFIRTDQCTGCGLCEYRCCAALVHQHRKLPSSAITIHAEDRHRPRIIH